MKVESRIFEICAGVLLPLRHRLRVILAAGRPVGVVGLFLTGGLSLIIGDLLPVRLAAAGGAPGGQPGGGGLRRRRRCRASSRPGSYWPVGLAASAALVGISLAFFQIWLLVIAMVLLLSRSPGWSSSTTSTRPTTEFAAPPTRRAPFGGPASRGFPAPRVARIGTVSCPSRHGGSARSALTLASPPPTRDDRGHGRGGRHGRGVADRRGGCGTAVAHRDQRHQRHHRGRAQGHAAPACSGRGSRRTCRCSRSATASFVLGFGVSFWQAVIAGVHRASWSSFLLCGFVARRRASAARRRRWCCQPRGVRRRAATSCPPLISWVLTVGWETVLTILGHAGHRHRVRPSSGWGGGHGDQGDRARSSSRCSSSAPASSAST